VRFPPPWPGLILLAAIGWGCAASHSSLRERPLSVGDLVARVRARAASIRSLVGDGLLTVESPEGALNSTFDLRLKKPDSLRLDLRGPFGVRGGTLLLDRSRFLFYNAQNNTVVTGAPDSATLRKIVRLPMEFDDALRVFSGDFPAFPGDDSLLQQTEDGDRAILVYRTSTGRKTLEIDEESYVITGYRITDPEGNETLTASASRLRDVDTLRMPKLIRILFPGERRSLTIAYDDLKVNAETVCFYQAPSRAERRQP